MKEIRSKIFAVAAIALMAVSATACESAVPDGGNTTTTVISDNDSSGDTTDVPVIPEADDDGSKISVVEVTDAAGEAVTNADSKPVTELVILDEKGTVITQANGEKAKPNLTTQKTSSDSTSAADIGKPPKMENETVDLNGIEVKKESYGPTLTLPDIEAKAGEEVKFKINVSDNTGFTALVAYLDVNKDYFEFVKKTSKGGDTDDPNYRDTALGSNMSVNPFQKDDDPTVNSLLCLFFDSSNTPMVGDAVFATITLKVKEGTPAGKYDLKFDADGDGNEDMCNIIEGSDVIVLNPKYINGSITIKE